jgi:hypothetical protein
MDRHQLRTEMQELYRDMRARLNEPPTRDSLRDLCDGLRFAQLRFGIAHNPADAILEHEAKYFHAYSQAFDGYGATLGSALLPKTIAPTQKIRETEFSLNPVGLVLEHGRKAEMAQAALSFRREPSLKQ